MRAYHRVDPLMDERKSHYSPAQFGAFLKVQLLAGRQARRGWFRSEAALRGALPGPYVRHLDFLIAQGDIKMADAGIYVDGWDEWQEGDLTVRDRMAALRNRKRNATVTGTVTPTVTPPSPTAIRSSVGISVSSSVSSSSPARGRESRPTGSVDRDPLLAQIKAAVEAKYGPEGPTIPEPTRPLSAAEREREADRLEALALHQRYLAGEFTAAAYERLRADIGKQPDDLTRASA